VVRQTLSLPETDGPVFSYLLLWLLPLLNAPRFISPWCVLTHTHTARHKTVGGGIEFKGRLIAIPFLCIVLPVGCLVTIAEPSLLQVIE